MLKRNSKTIYLNNSRMRRRPRNKGAIVGAVIGISVLAGVGVALLPNAYELSVGEEVIGVVAKKEYIETALDTVQVQLEKQYDTDVKMDENQQIKKVRAAKKDLIDPNKLPSYLRENVGITLEFQELSIDGNKVAIIQSKEVLEDLKVELKKKYFDDATVKAEFVNDIDLTPVYVTEADLTSLDDLVDLCGKKEKKFVTYEVQPNDTLWGIARKLGVNLNDILKANEGMTEQTPLKIGQEIKAEVRTPVLGLKIIETPKVEEAPAN